MGSSGWVYCHLSKRSRIHISPKPTCRTTHRLTA